VSQDIVPLSAAFVVGLTVSALLASLAVQARRQRRLRAAQAALRSSQERLRLALDAANEIVWDWDLRTDAMYMPRFGAVYGYPESATPETGRAFMAHVHPDDLAGVAAAVEAARPKGQDHLDFEHRVRTGTGEYLWMHGRARVVERGPDGAPLRMVGACTDVTERRRMLERLQLADRMVAVGTLAAGVAHEINNPLAFVSANVSYALEALERLAGEEGPSPERLAGAVDECRSALGEAASGADRVRRIVQDLKLLSRTDEDRVVPTDVGRALETALHIARIDLGQRARITTRLAEVPPIAGDESRVSQVLLNLLVNAAQAIPEGQADRNEIEIRLGAEGGRVVLTVRDTGCGIPPENLKRIFDPFFTTKPIGIGTGLGLAISHRIVTALGGELDVESAPGRGATFRVAFPIAAGAAVSPAPTPAPPTPPRGGRVLVVDDEPLFCRAMARIIGPDHEVVTLGDPREALRRIEAGEAFDLVFADLVMPGMGGVDFHEALARLDPDLAARTLFVTGGTFTKASADFVERMGERVLEKPVEVEQVRAAVATALRPAGARLPLPSPAPRGSGSPGTSPA
jgi:PAS domain S-box-containing protein